MDNSENKEVLDKPISLAMLIRFALPTILSTVFMSIYTSVDGVWASIPVGELLSLVMGIYYFRKLKFRKSA